MNVYITFPFVGEYVKLFQIFWLTLFLFLSILSFILLFDMSKRIHYFYFELLPLPSIAIYDNATNPPTHTHKYSNELHVWRQKKFLNFNTLSICFIYFKNLSNITETSLTIYVLQFRCVYECVHCYVLTYVCMYVCLSVRFPEGRLCSISCKLFLSSMKWYKDDMKIFDLPQYKRCSLISPTLKIFFLSQKDSSRSKFSQCMLLLKVVIYWKCV